MGSTRRRHEMDGCHRPGRVGAQRRGRPQLELIDAAIERIEAIDPALNAVIIRWFDTPASSRLPTCPDGPFRGVPFLLKDLWSHFAGQPLTNGCRALKDALPVSPPTRHWSPGSGEAGLNIAGRTNSPEFGSLPTTEPMAWGPTRNPWNPDHSPGGSSGGSAAAVAAGMVPIRPRQRRRRLHPHPGLVLRAGRPQAVSGPNHARPVPRREQPRRRAVRQPNGPRHRRRCSTPSTVPVSATR